MSDTTNILADQSRAASEGVAPGVVAGADAMSDRTLRRHDDDPQALRTLACARAEQGHPEDALLPLLQAIQVMRGMGATAEDQSAGWSELHFSFFQALSGLDSRYAALLRSDYATWLDSKLEPASTTSPSVSVVLVVPQSAQWPHWALDSVLRQSYREIELTIVHSRPAQDLLNASEPFADYLRRCPFPVRLLPMPDAGEPAMMNAGVVASTGAFVNILRADHMFAPTRIAAFVEGVVRRNQEWGFAKVQFCVTAGQPRKPDARAARWHFQHSVIRECDTIGHAFIDQECIAADVSNLFFSRKLFDQINGFRDGPLTYLWDFALRALRMAEPCYVTTAEHCHRLMPPESGAISQAIDSAKFSLFQEFYARAFDEHELPPNPFAPCIGRWKLHFLKTVIHADHLRLLSLERLNGLARLIIEKRRVKNLSPLHPELNLVGLPSGEIGLSASLRALIQSCRAGGIPFVVQDLYERADARARMPGLAQYMAEEVNYRAALYCVNPNVAKFVRHIIESQRNAGGYGIGYWYWELEAIPNEWAEIIKRVDEVWVATDFVQEAFSRATNKPVVKIPPPIEVALSRAYRRSEFGLPEDRYLFLFSFDFYSFTSRKNPEGAIRAFKQAFPATRRDVGLVVKSINGSDRPVQRGEIVNLIAGDERIVLLDRTLSRDEVYGLESVVDAYISLHRAEGLGLGLAESMYLGKPVIGTAYSGNLEFMNKDNSCLVRYELIPIRQGEYLYHDERFRWAHPDEAQAAYYMQRLADDVTFRERIAQQGRYDIRTRFTAANTAALMRKRLSELGLL